MRMTGIFIDLKNDRQIKWWEKTAKKFVKVVKYETIVDTATNEPVGLLISIKGLFKNRVIKANNEFLSDPVKVRFVRNK